MDIKEKAEQSIVIIHKQIIALQKIFKDASKIEYDNRAKERIKRWKSRTVRLIAENISAIESEKLKKKEKVHSLQVHTIEIFAMRQICILGFFNH